MQAVQLSHQQGFVFDGSTLAQSTKKKHMVNYFRSRASKLTTITLTHTVEDQQIER